MPQRSKTFLNTNINHNINSIYNEHLEETSQYVYFGLKEGIQQCINVNLHTDNELKLQFNVDGLPLFKSDKKQFWPILCKIFSKIDIYKPFVVATFCGNSKPASLNHFLSEFIADLNNIFEQWVSLRMIRYLQSKNSQFYLRLRQSSIVFVKNVKRSWWV